MSVAVLRLCTLHRIDGQGQCGCKRGWCDGRVPGIVSLVVWRGRGRNAAVRWLARVLAVVEPRGSLFLMLWHSCRVDCQALFRNDCRRASTCKHRILRALLKLRADTGHVTSHRGSAHKVRPARVMEVCPAAACGRQDEMSRAGVTVAICRAVRGRAEGELASAGRAARVIQSTV